MKTRAAICLKPKTCMEFIQGYPHIHIVNNICIDNDISVMFIMQYGAFEGNDKSEWNGWIEQ